MMSDTVQTKMHMEQSALERVTGELPMAWVRARAASVAHNGRCVCGRLAIPGPERRTGGYVVVVDGERRARGGRSWVPCERCLGTIRQTS